MWPGNLKYILRNTYGGPLAEYMPLMAALSILSISVVLGLGERVESIFETTRTEITDRVPDDPNGPGAGSGSPGGPSVPVVNADGFYDSLPDDPVCSMPLGFNPGSGVGMPSYISFDGTWYTMDVNAVNDALDPGCGPFRFDAVISATFTLGHNNNYTPFCTGIVDADRYVSGLGWVPELDDSTYHRHAGSFVAGDSRTNRSIDSNTTAFRWRYMVSSGFASCSTSGPVFGLDLYPET